VFSKIKKTERESEEVSESDFKSTEKFKLWGEEPSEMISFLPRPELLFQMTIDLVRKL